MASHADSPPPEWPREVKVLPDESLWALSMRVYGDGRYFAALWEENRSRGREDGTFAADTTVACPSPETLKARWPAACAALGTGDPAPTEDAANCYVTRSGDTLFEIARNVLGQASRFGELTELNRHQLGESVGHLDPLPAGLRLVLPGNLP
jgi:nucleoid-associated protein YgaU